MDVTPEMAKEWFDKRRRNRTPSEALINSIAYANLKGKLDRMPDTIKFNPEGLLNDGQHRCKGIFISGRTAKGLTIQYDVPDEVVDRACDGGRSRSTRDRLAIQGIPFGKQRCAVVNLILHGEIRSFKSNLDLQFEAEKNLGIEHMAAVCHYSALRIPTPLAAAATLVRPLDPAFVDWLLKSISNGDLSTSDEDSPIRNFTRRAIYRFCQRLLNEQTEARGQTGAPSRKAAKEKINPLTAMKVFLRGFESFFAEEPLTTLKLDADGYPKIMKRRAKAGFPVHFIDVESFKRQASFEEQLNQTPPEEDPT